MVNRKRLKNLNQHKLPDRCFQLYTPYPSVEREPDTLYYSYSQTVNHAEAQYSDGTTFVFKDIQSTMEWLALPQNTDAIVIVHFGGAFDFQMIYKYFLSEDVLHLKKAKAPLMRGNKIISAVINN